MSFVPPQTRRPDPPEGWKLVEVAHPRLEGWSTRGPFLTPTDAKIEVRRIEAVEGSAELFDPDGALAVYVDVILATGERQAGPWPLFFHRLAGPDLQDLPAALDYVREIVGTDDIDAGWTQLFALNLSEPAEEPELTTFRGEGGPLLSSLEFETAATVDASLRQLNGHLAAEGDDGRELARRVGVGFRAAYRLGRAIQAAELSARFAVQLERGAANKDQGRPGGFSRGKDISEEAAARNDPLMKWAQSIIDTWPTGLRFTRSELARRIHDGWQDRPIYGGPASPPELLYLSTKLIPAWIEAGFLKPPPDKRAH